MNPGTPQLDLHDIHLPNGISWWPPAPGWWILLSILIVLAVSSILVYRYRQHRRLHKAAKQALDKISQAYTTDGDDQLLVKSLSIWLRRVSLSVYPRNKTAGLTGAAWLDFLDQQMTTSKQSIRFNDRVGRVLIDAPYRPASDIQAQALITLCQAWLQHLPRQGSAQP